MPESRAAKMPDKPLPKGKLQRFAMKAALIAKSRSPFAEHASDIIADAAMARQSRATYDPAKPIMTTVVIPVFNTREYLGICLDSVLGQTQSQIEVVLVDDGSTDGSLDIEREYAARDPRIRLITQSNLRQGTARNRGLSIARGKYVYFMDSDDAIVSDLFEVCYAACEKDDLDFVCFDTLGFRGKPSSLRPDLFPEIKPRRGQTAEDIRDGVVFWNENYPEQRLPFVCWLQYFRKSFLTDNDLYFKEGTFFEDNDWIVRVHLSAQRMRFLPRALHRYRARPGSNVKSGFTIQLAESCPAVFEALVEIGRHETNEARIRVLDGAHYALNLRFDQLCELSPDPHLLQQMQAFSRDLCRGFGDAEASSDYRRWHLAALCRLVAGVTRWQGFDFDTIRREIATISIPGLPDDIETHKVGVFGPTRERNRLAILFDCQKIDLVHIAAGNDELSGNENAISLDDMKERHLDYVIAANAGVQYCSIANLQRIMGRDTVILRESSSAYELEWIDFPQILKTRPRDASS